MPKPPPPTPLAVRRALKTLGADVRTARRRRRLPLDIVAQRALTTRQTVGRIEKGDPTVAMGTWATVLFVLGLHGRLADVAAAWHDEVGLALESEQLPKRVRLPGRPRTRSEDHKS